MCWVTPLITELLNKKKDKVHFCIVPNLVGAFLQSDVPLHPDQMSILNMFAQAFVRANFSLRHLHMVSAII